MDNFDKKKKEEEKLIRAFTYDEEGENTSEKNGEGVSDEKLRDGIVSDDKEEISQKDEMDAIMNDGELKKKEPSSSGLVRGIMYEDEPMEKAPSKKDMEQSMGSQMIPNVTENVLPKRVNGVSRNSIQKPVTESVEEAVVMADTLNFDLMLLRRILFIQDTENGESTIYKYLIRIVVWSLDGKETFFDTEVMGDQAKGTQWLKKATHSLATLPKGKDQILEFEYKVQCCLETREAPTEIVYQNAGWREIQGLGWRYVYEDGFVGSNNNLIHAVNNGKYTLDVNRRELGTIFTFNQAMGMRYICKSELASTELLLFVHATVLSELFEQAKYPLHFAFGVMGVTNSRKTSLVTTMAQIFHRENLKVDAEFATATSCGIEKTLGLYRDAPVLIDDFKPGVNRARQAQLDGKLDEVLRYAGNRVPKQRMTDFMPDGNKKFFAINGGIIMTMELVTGVMSSLTRMFLTEINSQEVLNDKLQIYQEQRWILPTHIYDFLEWVTENFALIVAFISEMFPELRRQYVSAIGRYSEMYASLLITAIIIGKYARARGFWDDSQVEIFCHKSEEILKGELGRMEVRVKKRDKAELVMEALRDAINKGIIVPIKLNKMTSERKCDVYENDYYYFVRAKSLRCIANEYAKSNQENVEIVNDDELIGLLERLNILEIYERKDGSISRSRKLPIQFKNAFCYLYLKKEKIWELDAQ